jgi:hypothetical protein
MTFEGCDDALSTIARKRALVAAADAHQRFPVAETPLTHQLQMPAVSTDTMWGSAAG